jgi:hypothetical protein
MLNEPIPYDEFTGVPEEQKRSRTKADTQRDLLDSGFTPVEAHTAMMSGDIPDDARDTGTEDPLRAAMK